MPERYADTELMDLVAEIMRLPEEVRKELYLDIIEIVEREKKLLAGSSKKRTSKS